MKESNTISQIIKHDKVQRLAASLKVLEAAELRLLLFLVLSGDILELALQLVCVSRWKVSLRNLAPISVQHLCSPREGDQLLLSPLAAGDVVSYVFMVHLLKRIGMSNYLTLEILELSNVYCVIKFQ